MRLSFSTRGWPNLTWDEMVDTALDMGFTGIEVYNLPKFDDMLAKGGPFHRYQTAATVRDLREKKLTIPCFDTSCDLSSDENAVSTLLELLEVAHNSHVPYLVVCALQDKEETVRAALEQLVPVPAEHHPSRRQPPLTPPAAAQGHPTSSSPFFLLPSSSFPPPRLLSS